MKICVYAICKNEEKHVKKWYNSMKEADEIYVLDTGSTDKSKEKLEKLGVFVTRKIIKPWRFDVARNESLKLVPNDADICVCTDFDEVFEKGWRKQLEKLWVNNVNHVRYNYNWNFDKNNKPLINFYIEKIHSRNDYKWVNPVHEVLKFINNNSKEICVTTDKITLNHHQNFKKSRSNYLPLLELSVKENPLNDRNMHYLGREYMYYNRYNEAIDVLIKHLSLKSATWKDERCASMRFISRCYFNLKRYNEALMWINLAIKEASYLRDGYMQKALMLFELKQYKNCIDTIDKALLIKKHPKTYINEYFSFNETPYDLLSICYYNLGNYDKSYKNVKIAYKMNPKDKRIKNNKKLIRKKRNSLL